ncbi:MAG: asparagine synthase (glutamine-hydrolyzing) [Verrucomicrobiia bacterium]
MCGICGKLVFDPEQKVSAELVDRMMSVISHRGPDGQGKYLSGPVGLGHARLAIIDLSTGDQPMTNEDGTIWLVYNGEIYNFQELRERLIKKGHIFRSTCDTEVIIHLYEEYGVECASHLRGMFAFALWDSRRQALYLARDRVGIKPLYYTNAGKAFVFGSEIKSILCDPDVKREVNHEAIHKFLTFLYLPGSGTLFKGIHKLDPGHYLFIKDGKVRCEQYWDLRFEPAENGKSLGETADELYEFLQRTVREHMISDVPVGVLLSGGVDSTAILSCAVRETSKKIATFTIGFGGEEFADERPFARMAAERFGTDHHEITITPQEFSDFLPSYVWHMEEPVCEAPAIALYYVSKLASQHVKVVLSGEGGDEAFGGYQNYRNLVLFERLKRTAGPFNGLLSSVTGVLGQMNGSARFKKYAPLFKVPLSSYYYSRVGTPFSYFNTHRAGLCTEDFMSAADDKADVQIVDELFSHVGRQPLLNQMLYVDTKTWLPDDLLVKADKMTMANSLELRVPLLDHLVLEFAAKLPARFKVKGMATKRILKEAFKDKIPSEIINRRKTGLPVPLKKWMRNELNGHVREILLNGNCLNRGYFRKDGIERLLQLNHVDGTLMKEVFSLLTLEMWHTEFVDSQARQAN